MGEAAKELLAINAMKKERRMRGTTNVVREIKKMQ
jgi:hypothetical protein